MAVTLTAAQLAAALRLGSTDEETAQATRLLATCTEIVTKHAPDAPDAIQNEAVTVSPDSCSTRPRRRVGPVTPTSSATPGRSRCCCPTGCTGPGRRAELMALDRRVVVRVTVTGVNDFGETVETTTDFAVWAQLIQDRLARQFDAGGVYATADRVWRVRFNQAFLDALAAEGSVAVIYAQGGGDDGVTDTVTTIGEPSDRDRMRRRQFLDLLS